MKKGFTLIELLVVVIIVAIISTYAVTSYLDSVYEAENKAAKAKLEALAAGYERFALEHPSTSASLTTGQVLYNPSMGCTVSNKNPNKLITCGYVSRDGFGATSKYYFFHDASAGICGGSRFSMQPNPSAKTGKYVYGNYCAGVANGKAYDHFY